MMSEPTEAPEYTADEAVTAVVKRSEMWWARAGGEVRWGIDPPQDTWVLRRWRSTGKQKQAVK